MDGLFQFEQMPINGDTEEIAFEDLSENHQEIKDLGANEISQNLHTNNYASYFAIKMAKPY